MSKRVFVHYYFRTKFGQNEKAATYIEAIKAEALKLGISEVRTGIVEIGDHSPSNFIGLTFESADAFGRQWGGGSEYAQKSGDWMALWKKLAKEESQVLERIGSQLIYEN